MEIRIVTPEDAPGVVRTANRIDTRSLQTVQTFRAMIERIRDEGGRAFLEHRGFVRTNVMRLQALDLERAALPESTLPTLPLSTIDVDAICTLYREAPADIPSASPRAPHTDEDFRRTVVDAELVDREVSSVFVEDGRPVAFTIVVANHDDGRASAQMTAVARDRRGHGLAYAVKVASLRRARAAGLRTMLTSNDLENAPMLAVNRKLGFEAASVLVESYEKELTGSRPR